MTGTELIAWRERFQRMGVALGIAASTLEEIEKLFEAELKRERMQLVKETDAYMRKHHWYTSPPQPDQLVSFIKTLQLHAMDPATHSPGRQAR